MIKIYRLAFFDNFNEAVNHTIAQGVDCVNLFLKYIAKQYAHWIDILGPLWCRRHKIWGMQTRNYWIFHIESSCMFLDQAWVRINNEVLDFMITYKYMIDVL